MTQHILVVEDSRTQAQTLRHHLETVGYTVTVAGDGDAALARLREEDVALVLSDVVMPGKDGYELCRAIKGDPHLAGIPVVLLTSLRDPLDVVRGLEAGADNFLRKPYDAEQLVARIRSMLYNRELRADGELQTGVELFFLGRRFMITSERQQILDLLVSTFQDLVDTNAALRAREEELASAQAALEAARDQAMEASRLKSAFLANMSHEIRTPMNGVLGMTSVLLRTELSDQQREYVEVVRQSGEALLALINDILDLSKVEAGKLDLDEIDFDPRTPIEEALGLLTAQARDKGLVLTAAVESDVPSAVSGDPGRLRQVLVNLLGNAVKFTEHGQVAVRAALLEQRDEDVVLRVKVSDTGPGIAAEDQAVLFERFSQVDGSSTRQHGGTGLGLAISRQLVGLMGGELRVDSTPGEGSTFWFTIRLGRPAGLEEGDQSATAVTPNMLSETRGRSRPRVLVVDDDGVNQRVAAAMLDRLGCRVHIASSGAEAVEAVQHDVYDAVLMDCQMPQMDGYQATERIRELPAGAHLPIIAMTAGAMKDDEARALAAGMDAYLSKPATLEDLQRVLDHWVGGKDREPQAAKPPEPPLVPAILAELRRTVGSTDEGALTDLVAVFLDLTRDRLAALHEGLRTGDVARVAAIAHTIKGSSQTMGVRALGATAGRLQESAERGELADAGELIDTLARQVADVAAAFRHQLDVPTR